MTNAIDTRTLERIVEDNKPCGPETVIKLLQERENVSYEDASEAVDTYCELRSDGMLISEVRADGGPAVASRQTNESPSGESEADIAALDMPSGEPTGQWFDGKDVRDESEFDGQPYGLPVLEDVGHPLVPSFDKTYFPRPIEGNRMDVEAVTRALSNPNYCVCLVGETGVGKNALLEYIFSKTNTPALRKNMGVGMTYEKLVGMHTPTEDGHFKFTPGSLLQSVRHGWAFIADELNAAPPEVTMPLHGVTEEKDRRKLVVDEESKVYTPHERFEMVATMNPTDYAGTNSLNRAFKNRFIVVDVPYLEREAEKLMLKEVTDIDRLPNGDDILDDLLGLAQQLRGQRGGDGGAATLTTSVSSRTLIKICNMIVGPDGDVFMEPKAATRFVLKGVSSPGDWRSISTAIDRFVG